MTNDNVEIANAVLPLTPAAMRERASVLESFKRPTINAALDRAAYIFTGRQYNQGSVDERMRSGAVAFAILAAVSAGEGR